MSLFANILLKPRDASIPNPDGASVFPEAPAKRPSRTPTPQPDLKHPKTNAGSTDKRFVQGSLDFSIGPGYSSLHDQAALNYGFQLGFGAHPWNWSTFFHFFNPPDSSEIVQPVGGEAVAADHPTDSQEYLLWGLEAGYNLVSHHNDAGVFRLGLPLALRHNFISQDDALLLGVGLNYSGGFPSLANPSRNRLPLAGLSGKVLVSPFEDHIETILMLNADLSVSTIAWGIGSFFTGGG